MAWGLLGKAFALVVGSTGAAATYSHLKKDENREKLAETVEQTVSDITSRPAGETFNAFADGSLEFFQNADKHVTNYGDAVLSAGEKTVNFVSDPTKAIEDATTRRLNEAFGIEADGEGNEGSSMWKWLLGGGAAIAGGGLLSKMFGKKNENDSGGGLGFGSTLLIVGAVIGVALDAFGIRTKLTNMFNELTGSDERTMDMTQDTSAEQNVRVGKSFFEDTLEAPSL